MIDFTNRVLPVFRLAEPLLDRSKIASLVKEFGFEGRTEMPIPGGGVRIERGTSYLEATPDHRYWFADDAQLWNPASIPKQLPSSARAEHAAWDILNRLDMVPRSISDATVFTGVAVNARTKTACATLNDDGTTQRYRCEDLDVYVGIRVDLQIPDPVTGEPRRIETQGAGTKVGVVFGDNGAIIGLNASWRDIVALHEQAAVLPPLAPAIVDTEHGRFGSSAMLSQDNYRLVYRFTVLSSGVSCLCPYWLFPATVLDGNHSFISADIATPAATFSSVRPAGAGLVYNSRTEASAPRPATTRCSIGISWKTFGNPHANDEVAAVEAQAAAAGWDVRFAWRDGDAWESDWSANAATWVADVDLAFYAGHANGTGWQLTDKSTAVNKSLTVDIAGILDTNRSIWRGKLKWLMIAACGPLQDVCTNPKGGDVFRWAGAFDGIRLMLGFASSTAGFTGEGARAMALARRGVPLARAWLRAAREEQPFFTVWEDGSKDPGRWVAALAGETGGESALNDLLPAGTGLAAGPMHATRLRAIWAPA